MPMLLLLACAAPPTALAPLDGPVEILLDPMGIAHIRAGSARDAFFAQGWQSAEDRIVQMELLRRRAWGRRAEVLGEEVYRSDLQSRALRLGTWAEATAAALPETDPELFEVLGAYRDGVNAWLVAAALGRDGVSLPAQAEALGAPIAPWRIEDSLAIEKLLTAGLSMRADQDITLGLLDLLLGRELFEDIYMFAPFDEDWVAPDFYGSAGPPPPGQAPSAPRPPLDPAQGLALWREARAWDFGLGGSNNQAVAGSHTQSGHALLASDSHQGLGHPSVYWLVHLQGGDLDVLGATFPGVPMVLFGSNGRIAWGPTTSIYDAADVWLESFDGQGDEAVLFQGQAVPIAWRTEEIQVRGEDAPRVVTLGEVPHHGPLFPSEALGLPVPLALSIRWNGFQARSIGRAFLDLARAEDVDQARAALGHYFTGGMHWLFADVEGRIGYESWSELPLREQVDPANPPVTLLPGTGGYEWREADGTGLAPFQHLSREQLPHRLDPPEGFLVTANNDPVGQTADNAPFDAPVYLSGVFDIGTRAYRPRQRIEEILAERPLSLDDLRGIQLDTRSRLAERLLPFLLQAAERRPDLAHAEAIGILREWSGDCEVEEAGPSIFHAWLIETSRAMLADESELLASLLFEDTDATLGLLLSKFVLRWLQTTAEDIDEIEAGAMPFPSASGRNFFDDRATEPLESRDEVLLAALRTAVDALGERMTALGADPEDLRTWRWGLWHTVELVDPLLAEAGAAPAPKSGGLYTVDVADSRWLEDGALPAVLAVRNAPSNRFVFELDPGGLQARMSLPGGQAERPDSPFHNSLHEGWLAGEHEAVPFAEEEFRAAAVAVHRLEASLRGVRRRGG